LSVYLFCFLYLAQLCTHIIDVIENNQQILVNNTHPFCLQCGTETTHDPNDIIWVLSNGLLLQEKDHNTTIMVKVLNGLLEFYDPSVTIKDGNSPLQLSCYSLATRTSHVDAQLFSSSKCQYYFSLWKLSSEVFYLFC